MPEPLAYLNGQFIARAEAHLPLHDAGLVFGATITDLCRTFNHRLFRLSDHLTRFRQSCRSARVHQPIADQELTQIAEHVVSHNAALLAPEQDLALVMIATPGPIGYYAGQEGGPGDDRPTLILHTFPLPFARYRRFFEEGIHLVIPPTRQIPALCVDPRIKHRSRLHWWRAEKEARAMEPGAVALLLDSEDKVTETATSNFLLVQGGAVVSPPREAILGGISLQMVEELCAELGICFEERPLTLTADCLTASEAFLSCTSYCLAGVSQINGIALPWPGPVFLRLLDAWSARVGLDIRRQILSNR